MRPARLAGAAAVLDRLGAWLVWPLIRFALWAGGPCETTGKYEDCECSVCRACEGGA